MTPWSFESLLGLLVLEHANLTVQVREDPNKVTGLDLYSTRLGIATGDSLQQSAQMLCSRHTDAQRVIRPSDVSQDLADTRATSQQFEDPSLLAGALLCASATLAGRMLELCLRYAALIALPFARDSRKVTAAAALPTPALAALMSTSRCLV